MRLVPLTNESWNIFRSWFKFDVPPPKEAILVAEHIEGVEYLIGGTCIYSTDGPYVLFEHFGLNPHAPIVTRHAVAKQVFRAAKSYCTIHNKVAFTWVAFQGGIKMLEQVGFTPQPQAHLMTYIPGQDQAASPARAMEQNNIPVEPKPEPTPPADDDVESAMARMAAADEKAKALESSGASLEEEDDQEDEDDDLMPEIPKPAKKAKRAKKRVRRRSLA